MVALNYLGFVNKHTTSKQYLSCIMSNTSEIPMCHMLSYAKQSKSIFRFTLSRRELQALNCCCTTDLWTTLWLLGFGMEVVWWFSSGPRISFREDLKFPPRNNQVRCACVRLYPSSLVIILLFSYFSKRWKLLNMPARLSLP